MFLKKSEGCMRCDGLSCDVERMIDEDDTQMRQ